MMALPRSAAIFPHSLRATMSAAWTPKRVASTRSNAVGVPPRWMWPSTVERVSKPVAFSINSAICCPIPPSRMWPNSSSFSLIFDSPAASLAPSATTTMEKFTSRVLCRRVMCSQTRSISMGRSGMRITSAPPAMPEYDAIHPACRPITSQTMTRLCDSAVECSRSMASVAICTAVSNPKVRSVPERSLSMVLGTPTTLTPIVPSRVATPGVSSPPMATTAWRLSALTLRMTASAPPCFLNGLVREVPRMVPPRWRMPLVASRVRRSCSGGSNRPRQPSRTPITSSPCCSPRRTTARITAFKPGQSPPPVSTAIFMVLPSDAPSTAKRDRSQSGVESPAGDHLHGPEEEVLLGVGLLSAPAAGGSLEPLPGDHVAVVRKAAEQHGVALGEVPLDERAEQGLELRRRYLRVAAFRVERAVEGLRDVHQLVQNRGHPLLGDGRAEELRPQSNAIERFAPFQDHLRAVLAQRPDGGTRAAPRLSGDEEDPGCADVGELRELARHVLHDTPAQQGSVGTLGAACAHPGNRQRPRLHSSES